MPQATQWKRDICNVCCDAGCKPYVPCCIRSMKFQYQVFTVKDDNGVPDNNDPTSCLVGRFTLTNNTNGQEGPDWSTWQFLDSESGGFDDDSTSIGGIVYGACTFGIDIPVEHIFCNLGSANFTAKITICNQHIGLINNFPIWVHPQHGGLSLGVSFGDGSIDESCFFDSLTPEPASPILIAPGGSHEFTIDFSFIDYTDCNNVCVDPTGIDVLVIPQNTLFFPFDDSETGTYPFNNICYKALNCDSGPELQPPWTGITAESCDDLFSCPKCDCTRDDPVGFAEFNGTDSYIALTQSLPQLDVPFVLEAEIRLHNVTTFWPILGVEATGGFLGMDDDDLVYGNLTLVTTWVPFLDVWFKWRLEFEQPDVITYRLLIDNVEVFNSPEASQLISFINLGVFRHNDPGVIWGNFDMRFLKIQTGTPGNLVTVLDMPLIENALDLSASDNHGTTFNMDLPSG